MLPQMNSNCKSNHFARVGGLLVALVLSIGTASAQKGSFEIRNASTRLSDGVYLATARVEFELSDEALEALNSGVVMPIQLQIKLTRQRKLWFDNSIATLEQSYQLSYQPMSERYVIKNVNSGEQDSFATLFSALNTMGRVVDLPIIDQSILDPDAKYEIALRVVLDQTTLPGPLRLLAFWDGGFKLQSDWYVWNLES